MSIKYAKVDPFSSMIPLFGYLDLQRVRYWLRSCLGKRSWYIDYDKALNDVGTDMKSSLDVVTLMRRLRSHGLGLSMLMPPIALKMVSIRANHKPLYTFIDQSKLRE